MRNGNPSSCVATETDFDPETEILALSAQTARLVSVAQTLVNGQRYVDIDGLQEQVGLLCAKALDLPPSRTKLLRLELVQLASALDALNASLRANAA